MDEKKFTSILSRAQELMLDENFNRMVEENANSYAGRRGVVSTTNVITDAQPIQPIQTAPILTEKNVRGLEALPEFMRESFRNTPPLSGEGSDTPLGKTTLDSVSEKIVSMQSQPQRKLVTETVIPTSAGIDYSLIKTIIDESVSRHLNTLNESAGPTMKGMRFINGNTFQFIDNKGNLYEGVLKLKKRAK